MRLNLSVAAAFISTTFLAACTDQSPGPPVVQSLNPASTVSGVALPVTISGQDFLRGLRTSLQGNSAPTVDQRFSASLRHASAGSFELDLVEWVDVGTLRAVTPSTLPTGRYDLVVTGPSQQIRAFVEDNGFESGAILAVDFYNWSTPVCGR